MFSRQYVQGAIAEAQSSSQLAFVLLREANLQGGDVTGLAARFNEALRLLSNASALMQNGLYDRAAAYAGDAQALFDAIGSEAQALGARASAETSNKRTVVLVLAPLGALAATLLSYFAVRFWRMRHLIRTVEADVR
jgi:hypothetical protein